MEQKSLGNDGMTDREKVSKGLECCGVGVTMNCSKCPYDSEKLGCFRNLKADALNLLKEQEPRVMTKEEVLSQPEGAVVWRECHLSNGQYELRPMVCDGKGCCGDFGLSAECKYDFDCRYYVRYWTNKPTDEQRKAVKWNADGA